MLKEIKHAISGILELFSISTNDFEEKRDFFQFFNGEFKLLSFDISLLFKHIEILGNSIEIKMQALDKIIVNSFSNKDEVIKLITQNLEQEIQIFITIYKDKLIKKYFGDYQDTSKICMYIKPTTFISNLDLNKIEKEIFNQYTSQIVMLPLCDIDIISNEFLILIGNNCKHFDLKKNCIYTKKAQEYSEEKIKLLNLYCNTERFPKNITPKHLYYPNQIKNNGNHLILKELNKQFIKLILYFICNLTHKDYFLIRGYKEVKIVNNLYQNSSINLEQLKFLYNMYDSIYTMQTQDKILIARNVMTIYLEEDSNINELLAQINKIHLAYESSTESYIKDKVKNFFDKKKDLEKYVRDTSESISKQISNISDNIMKAWLSFTAAILGASVTYFAKADLLLISIFFLVFSILNYLILKYQIKVAKEEQQLTKDSYNHFLRNVDVINDERKREVTGDIVEKKHILLNSVIRWFKNSMNSVTIISVVLFLVIGIIGLYQYNLHKKVNTTSKNESVIESTYHVKNKNE